MKSLNSINDRSKEITRHDDAVLTLDSKGVVCDCNDVCEMLFKYQRSDLQCHHVSMLVPKLAGMDLVQNGLPNPQINFLCRIGYGFQLVTRDGGSLSGRLNLNLLDARGIGRLTLIVRLEGTDGVGALMYKALMPAPPSAALHSARPRSLS